MATKPKLALIPSAYKASKVYSVLPSDGVGDFDFSRPTTATRVNKDGLIETVSSNIPRLNYPMIDGVVSGCPSLLLEPQRINYFRYSELSEGTATGGFSYKSPTTTVNANTTDTTSPKGDNSSAKITTTISNSVLDFYKDLSVATDDVTYSLFVKKASITDINLEISGSGVSPNTKVDFDLEKVSYGTFSGDVISAFILDYGNGWYRIGITSSNSPTSSSIFRINIPYTGSFYVWGLQLEQGSYATSYIPTNGEVNGVTRSAETCNGAGDADTFNDSEGVLMAEISALVETETFRDIRINDGSSNNRVAIRYSTTTNEIEAYVVSNGTETFKGEYISQNITNFNKIAIKYKENNFSFFVNGFQLATDISGSTPIGLNNINFSTPSFNFYGNTKQLQYFDTALTDSDLETLTSWTSFNEMAQGQLYTIQ